MVLSLALRVRHAIEDARVFGFGVPYSICNVQAIPKSEFDHNVFKALNGNFTKLQYQIY